MTHADHVFDTESQIFFENVLASPFRPTVAPMDNEPEWSFDAADDPIRYVARRGAYAATWRDVISGLQSSANCRDALSSTLCGRPEEQVFWETPALTIDALDEPFEFVALNAGLHRPPDPSPFARYIAGVTDPVVTFTNLGGDATLVVPTDLRDGTTHNYLLSFLRTASTEQTHAFWQAAGAAIEARVDHRPVWVSTSGGGVAWLHLRLDDRPKYYMHGPYRRP